MVSKGIHVEGMSTSILETPTYIMALVLVMFFVISLGFEKIIHHTKAALQRRGREGLARSVDKVVMEITFVGLVSLLLTLFQQYVPEICVPFSETQVQWTILQNVAGCPCCLKDTAEVTTCAQIYHGCAFNATNHDGYCGCDLGWEESAIPDPPADPGTEAAQCVNYDSREIYFLVNEFGKGMQEMASYYNFSSPTEFCREIVDTNERQVAEAAMILQTEAGLSPAGGGQRRLLGDPYGATTGGGRALRAEAPANESTDRVSTTAEYFRNYDNNTHLIPEIGVFKCDGPFFAGHCEGNNTHPAISDEALHQTHLLVFITVGMHVICSVICVMVALLRMLQWRRWQAEAVADQGIPMESLITCVDLEAAAANVTAEKAAEENGTASPNGQGAGEAAAENGGELGTQMSTQTTGAEAIEPPEGLSNALSSLKTQPSLPSSADLAPDPREVSALKKAALSFRRRWLHRDSRLAHPRSRWGEAAICVGQALLPNLVSRSEFKTIRAGYIASHGLHHEFDFVREVSLHLDFDLASLIGQSVIVYLILITEWLITGLASYSMGIYSAVSYFTLFLINVGLVAAVRYACRGQRPHRVRAARHWWQGAHWLCHPLAGIIFLTGKVYSNALFFLWQFGPESCFFSDSEIFAWDPAKNLPYWVAYIAPVIVLLWVASVTVPAWAVVMHTRPPVLEEGEEGSVPGSGQVLSPKHSGRVLEAELSGSGAVVVPGSPTMSSGGGSRRFTTQGTLMAEIARLQAELMEMQKE